MNDFLLPNRVNAPAMKWLAFQQSPDRLRDAPQKPVPGNRLIGIGGAGRHKPAARRGKRRYPLPVYTDNGQSDGHYGTPFLCSRPARANVSIQTFRRVEAATVAASRFGRTSRSQPAAMLVTLKRASSRKRRLQRLRCVAPPSFFPTTVPTRARSSAVPR